MLSGRRFLIWILLAIRDSTNLVPVSQVLTISGTLRLDNHNLEVRKTSSRSGN